MSSSQASCHVAVIGAGSFGSVLTNIMAKNGHKVTLWLRDPTHFQELQSSYQNKRYLDDFNFDESVSFDCNLEQALVDAKFVFLAVPSKAFRSLLPQIKSCIADDAVVVSTAKGIEPGSFKLMSEIIKEELPTHQVAALSGPNLAVEIARGELTGSVVASPNNTVNTDIQNLLASRFFRVYDNQDIFGVELAGALKNIYAIAAGMSSALGMGENSRSMLLTRSLAEMSRFAAAKGANPMTFLGLAGVGDLFVTCSSPLSRNFRLGQFIAKGLSIEEAITKISSTVEGYATVKTVCEEAERLDVYMPLANALYQVLYHKKEILDVVKDLMLGDNNHDVEFSRGS
jgi:glycerol-3-phosphate dehydrogenase (NAD(P)+)